MIYPEFASKINKKLPNLSLGSFCLSQKRSIYALFYLLIFRTTFSHYLEKFIVCFMCFNSPILYSFFGISIPKAVNISIKSLSCSPLNR